MQPALANSRDCLTTSRPGSRRIRLMIVDDSVVARAVLSRIIESDDRFEIAAVAGTAEDAIAALGSVRVDTILLDLEMPGEGGLKSIPRILDAAFGAHVMIVSSLADEGAAETVAALALGAADALPKPGTGRFHGRFSEILLSRLNALGYADRVRDSVPPPPVLSAPLRAMSTSPLRLLAIGASTGGIHALGNFFSSLPRRIGAPIMVTQHLPVPFMPVFARQLSIAAGRETLVAEDGMKLLDDRIIVAPGDAHITIDNRGSGPMIVLDRSVALSGCMPSIDPMFRSAGEYYGDGALGVVLTGMGRDGVQGAAALIGKGGAVLAQDEASSAVWGMPRAIVDAGLASAVLDPEKLARRVSSRTKEVVCK